MAAKLFTLSLAMTSITCYSQHTYPTTKKVEHSDDYFGVTVSDPYRWLEDDRSEDTKDWVEREVTFTNDYLGKIPFREEIRNQLRDKWNYEKISAPFEEGDYVYYYKNDGLQAQSVLYRKDKTGKEEVFLDPNKFSAKGTTSLSNLSFNKKGTLAAYAISEGGSDWNKIIVIDAVTKQQIGDTLVDIKFSGIAWQGDEGFYYSSYDKPQGSELSAQTDTHKVYFHTLGTKQKQDQLIIGGSDFKRRYLGAYLSDDERFLIVSASNTTYGNELYIKDLKNKTDFITIQKGYDCSSGIIDTKGDFIYVLTDKNAPNNKLQKFDINHPEKWIDVISETENVLTVSTGGGYIFAKYMKDALSYVRQLDYNGALIRTIELPGNGTAGGFGGKLKQKGFVLFIYELHYSRYNLQIQCGNR